MGLGHLPVQTRHNDNYIAAIFDDTWGHFAPKQNVSYKGKVRFFLSEHGHYGRQPLIMNYEFPNLTGPYIHDRLFDDVFKWEKKYQLETGKVYEVILTFRNYRFYYGKPVNILTEMDLGINT